MRYLVVIIALATAMLFVATCDEGLDLHPDLAVVPEASAWDRLFDAAEAEALEDEGGGTSVMLAAVYHAGGEGERVIAFTDRAAAMVMDTYRIVSPSLQAFWPRVATAWHAARRGRFDRARTELQLYLAEMARHLFFAPEDASDGLARRTEFGFYMPHRVETAGLAAATLLVLHLDARGALHDLSMPQLPRGWSDQLPTLVADVVAELGTLLRQPKETPGQRRADALCTPGDSMSRCAYLNAVAGNVEHAVELAEAVNDIGAGDAPRFLARTWLLLSGPDRALEALGHELDAATRRRSLVTLVGLALFDDARAVPLHGF